jgi:hydrogenase 3 maturation protease
MKAVFASADEVGAKQSRNVHPLRSEIARLAAKPLASSPMKDSGSSQRRFPRKDEDWFLGALGGRVKGRVVILGIGNEARGDDGFGPFMVESLRGRVKAALFSCGTSLENYYNPIVKAKPDVIIIFDAVEFNGPFGEIGIFGKDDIVKAGFSTHTISPKFFMEFLERSVHADIMMVGVKPRSTEFGEGLSVEVKDAADMLTGFFTKILPVSR